MVKFISIREIFILFFFLQFVLLPYNAFGQLIGRVVDETGAEVRGASVYISNTTYGTSTTEGGQFHISRYPKPPFHLTVSCIGYQSASVVVNDSFVLKMEFVLKTKTNDINEVVIRRPDKNGWEKYGAEFVRDFIGYSKFAQQTEIQNKEVLEFTYDAEQKILNVYATQPIKIRNKATGYLITYWLENYQKNYRSRKIFYKGTVQFEPLVSKKAKVKKQWENNRRSAYLGSLNHFMRSVYDNKVYKDSFELRVYRKIAAKDYGKTIPFRTSVITGIEDTIFHNTFTHFLGYDAIDLFRFLSPLQQWFDTTIKEPQAFLLNQKLADTTQIVKRHVVLSSNPDKVNEKRIQFFDYDYIPEDTLYKKMISSMKIMDTNGNRIAIPPQLGSKTYAHLFTQKIPLDSFVTRNGDGGVLLKFKDYLHITYLPEEVEPAFVQANIPPKHIKNERQTSLLYLENTLGITVLPNGNFYEPYDLHIEEYWSYEKIDKIMPLDYKP